MLCLVSSAQAVRGQALAGVACRLRQKKYESPQSTPVAAAGPTPPGHRRAAGRPFSRWVARCPTWWHTAARTSTDQ